MNVRKYRRADERSLIDLWATAFPDDPPHNDPSSVIAAKLAVDDLIFVAERERDLIGACIVGYDGHRGWLYAVATAQGSRRSGVGKALVAHAVAALGELGCRKVNVQIRATNTEVAAFYESLGFEREERVSMGLLLD